MTELKTVFDAKTKTISVEPVSQEEIDMRPKETEESVRSYRSWLLKEEVDAIAGNALRWGALTTDQQQAWADYRQALLDVPQQEGFPETITWPTKPE